MQFIKLIYTNPPIKRGDQSKFLENLIVRNTIRLYYIPFDSSTYVLS